MAEFEEDPAWPLSKSSYVTSGRRDLRSEERGCLSIGVPAVSWRGKALRPKWGE